MHTAGLMQKVTVDLGDGTLVEVPIWVAMRIRYANVAARVVAPRPISDGQLLAAADDVGDLRCPPLHPWEFLAHVHYTIGVPIGPRPNWLVSADVLGSTARGPTDPQPWRATWSALDPQPLPPGALELVPHSFRDAVLDLATLALAEATTGEVHESRLKTALDRVRADFEECGTPWRKPVPPRRRRGPFPPLQVLLGAAAALPAGRVQAELLALATEGARSLLG